MNRPIQSLTWSPPNADTAIDVTDAIDHGIVSSTPHPDEGIDRPKGYSIQLTLKPDGAAFAKELQDALMSLDPPRVSLRLEGVDAPLSDVPVGVSKVPHLGEQNEAELSVKPDGHDQFHEHF